MKSESEYANELIEKYKKLSFDRNDEINNFFTVMSAIKDVENTLDALYKVDVSFIKEHNLNKVTEYYRNILKILINKI